MTYDLSRPRIEQRVAVLEHFQQEEGDLTPHPNMMIDNLTTHVSSSQIDPF